MSSTDKAPRDMEDDGAIRSCVSSTGGAAESHPYGMMASSANRGTILEPGRGASGAEDRTEADTSSSTASSSSGSSSSGGGGDSTSHGKGKQHLQQKQQHQHHRKNHRVEEGMDANRIFVEQLRRRHEEEEEEEKEEEEEEEEEEEQEEANSDRDDGFLDDFVRELDGASSEDEQAEEKAEMQPPMSGGDGDEQVARALQEAEWRRNLLPLPGMQVPSDREDDRRVSSIICSGSGSGSIFDTGGCSGGGASGGGSSISGGGAAAVATGVGALAACGGGGASRPPNCGVVCHSPYTNDDDDEAAIHGDGANGGIPAQNANKGSNRRGKGLGTTVGTERPRGQGSVRGATLGAWPPGGLGEGEGLRINDFPDEIVEKVAGFASLPRCVSKRIEKYRVKVVRERVFTALETSATLPASKAKEVEDAIFALCGNSVTKAYKAKAREMSFNLRVGKNDPLRERLLSGSLLPSDLVRMSSNDLAPLSVRRERERFARKRIREVTSSRDSPFHTVTDRFACVECGHEKTQYRTWRRKAVVDRVRVIVQCLQCRHSWEL